MSRVSMMIPIGLPARPAIASQPLRLMFGGPQLRRNEVAYFAFASERVGTKCKLAIEENGEPGALSDGLSRTKLKELVAESPLQNDDRAPCQQVVLNRIE